ncbi:MAG: hypothetical protein V1702_03435 [Candidatus Woesearchaeota archaeon]
MKWQLSLIFFIFIEIASAQGIGVAPARLEFSGEEHSIAERQFIIYNPSEEEMHFSIEGPFLFSEKIGLIEAGGSRKIIASAQLQKDESTKITIVADGGKEGITLNTGVAIEAVISVLRETKDMKKVIGPIISASIVAVGLGIFGIFGGLRKNRKFI